MFVIKCSDGCFVLNHMTKNDVVILRAINIKEGEDDEYGGENAFYIC